MHMYYWGMANITIRVPDEVAEKWRADKNRKGVIVKLLAEHYGFVVNKSRFVAKA